MTVTQGAHEKRYDPAACVSLLLRESTPVEPAVGRKERCHHDNCSSARRTPIQIVALLYGIVFLLVGVAGFIPGITQNLSDLQFAGHEGHAMLLGIFHVSILHNIVHLLFGVAGVILARTPGAARHYLLWGGIIYLGLFLYGMFIDYDSAANFVPLSDANNWLHLGLGATMVGLSFLPRTTGTSRDNLAGRETS